MGYPVYYGGQITVHPPLTEEHASVLLAVSRMEPTEETAGVFAAIAASAQPELPYHGDLIEVAADGATLSPPDWESRHGLGRWLVLLVEHLLKPPGYVLSGKIEWRGEESDDRGAIYVHDNLVEEVGDVILNAGPSWAPFHYVDDRLKETIRELVESSDDAGCSPGLAVVSAETVGKLKCALDGV